MLHQAYLMALFLASGAASFGGVALVRAMAPRLNIVDIPNERSSHSEPMPLCGGVAIVVVNAAAWAGFGFLHLGISGRQALALLTGGLLIAFVSLIDDLYHVPYPIRFAVQGIAAIVFMAGFTFWDVVSLPLAGRFSLGIAGIALTLLWIVGLTNAYNFMDGIDGMVGGQGTAAGLGWVLLGLLTGHPLLSAAGVCLAASSCGFLVHNWHPARIFMGDVGATFLGYSFGALTVIAARSDPKLALAGILLVWPSIFDPAFTVLRRLRHGHSIFAGHRTFLFHRLIHAGWSHASAASLYLPLPIVGAVLACTWERGSRPLHESVGISVLVACFALWSMVRLQERRHAARPAALAFREDRGSA